MENKEFIDFAHILKEKAFEEAACLPVDRYFLEPYLEKILSFDKKEFLLYHLENFSTTYTVQLFLCLPELWENITFNDIIVIVEQFSNIFSYYTIIEFVYVYIEIDIINLILNLSSVDKSIKKNIVNYIVSSFYPNLIKSEGDYLFFEEELYGIQLNVWAVVKQRMLIDDRFEPALTSIEEVLLWVTMLKVDPRYN